MTFPDTTRREFLYSSASALGGGWLSLRLPLVAALSACAREAAERGTAFVTLAPAESRTLAAFAAQILPSDELPGAEEAGVIHFIDQALSSSFADLLPPIRAGAGDLDARAQARNPAVESFADLAASEQIEVMREIEQSEFFFLARMLTLMGMFSDPSHGGNRGGVGLAFLQMEHQPVFQPPFGWYDAEPAAREGGAA